MPRPFDRKVELPPARKFPVAGNCTTEEKAEIESSLEGFGFETTSEGIRTLGLLFARAPRLRQVVKELLVELAQAAA